EEVVLFLMDITTTAGTLISHHLLHCDQIIPQLAPQMLNCYNLCRSQTQHQSRLVSIKEELL
ncbi:MAG: hypothetical protein MPL62_17475, partial [Alphaproteobacteria bacterium]|nr:hypothetical protein [Alphaproteobacteria bacterium]